VAFFIGVAAGNGIRVLSFVRLVATTFVVFSRVHLCSSGWWWCRCSAVAPRAAVGSVSTTQVDPEKNLADLFPGAGLEIYLDALKEMGAEKMEDLAYLRRSDLQDLDMEIAPADKKKLLELGLVAFLTKEGLGACVAYIRSVGVDMVDDLVYLKQSDVALMDLKQEYKDKLMDVLGRES
jgi:hypothetical protein